MPLSLCLNRYLHYDLTALQCHSLASRNSLQLRGSLVPRTPNATALTGNESKGQTTMPTHNPAAANQRAKPMDCYRLQAQRPGMIYGAMKKKMDSTGLALGSLATHLARRSGLIGGTSSTLGLLRHSLHCRN